jgi:anti-sigma factor RsiW
MSDHVDEVLLSRLVDGDLSLASREAVLTHLRGCPACAERHDELVCVAASLRDVPAVAWTPAQSAAILGSLEVPRRLPWLAGCAVAAAVIALVAAAWTLVGVPRAVVVPLAVAESLVVAPLISALSGELIAIAAVAVLGPLAAYPLARWR